MPVQWLRPLAAHAEYQCNCSQHNACSTAEPHRHLLLVRVLCVFSSSPPPTSHHLVIVHISSALCFGSILRSVSRPGGAASRTWPTSSTRPTRPSPLRSPASSSWRCRSRASPSRARTARRRRSRARWMRARLATSSEEPRGVEEPHDGGETCIVRPAPRRIEKAQTRTSSVAATSRPCPEAARGSQKHSGAGRSRQKHAEAARSSQKQPGAARMVAARSSQK